MTNLAKFIQGLNICLNYIVNEVGTVSNNTHIIRLEENNPFSIQEIKEIKNLGFIFNETLGILYFKEK